MKPIVIIPTYDNLEMLKILVKQVTDSGIPLIVVEDGQKQETIDWLKKQSFEVIYHNVNKGVATSWNDGIKRAIELGYTHFAIFNDDIEIPIDWWDKCKEGFKLADVVTIPSGLHFRPTPQVIPLAGWFFILSKRCIDIVGLFDEKIGKFLSEDTDFAIRCGLKNIKSTVIDVPIKHFGSATLSKVKSNNPKLYDIIKNDGYNYLRKKYPKLRMMI